MFGVVVGVVMFMCADGVVVCVVCLMVGCEWWCMFGVVMGVGVFICAGYVGVGVLVGWWFVGGVMCGAVMCVNGNVVGGDSDGVWAVVCVCMCECVGAVWWCVSRIQ